MSQNYYFDVLSLLEAPKHVLQMQGMVLDQFDLFQEKNKTKLFLQFKTYHLLFAIKIGFVFSKGSYINHVIADRWRGKEFFLQMITGTWPNDYSFTQEWSSKRLQCTMILEGVHKKFFASADLTIVSNFFFMPAKFIFCGDMSK